MVELSLQDGSDTDHLATRVLTCQAHLLHGVQHVPAHLATRIHMYQPKAPDSWKPTCGTCGAGLETGYFRHYKSKAALYKASLVSDKL